MAKEIERKFLVKNDSWRAEAKGLPYSQGYIPTAQLGQTVRVRLAGDKGYLTLKGPTEGITRSEFEYVIPVADAKEMLETMCDRPLIEKIRYRLVANHLLWEIDEFSGENAGLIIAEVELETEDQAIQKPHWLGQEVSGDPRYYNANLSRHPYATWSAPAEA
ncbi:MAG: CYTH domain-containing protein [Phormidesmis sp.]